MNGLTFSAEEIIDFVNECKQLQSIRSTLLDRTQFTILLQRMGTRWHGTVNEENHVNLQIIQSLAISNWRSFNKTWRLTQEKFLSHDFFFLFSK